MTLRSCEVASSSQQDVLTSQQRRWQAQQAPADISGRGERTQTSKVNRDAGSSVWSLWVKASQIFPMR